MCSCGPAHNIKTPFPFLERAPPDQIRRIHEIILSNETAEQKDIGIVNTIGKTTDYLQDYYVWMKKKRHLPPYEVLAELTPLDNSYLFKLIHDKQWETISSLFTYLNHRPEVKRIAEEWLSKTDDYRKLLQVRLVEAKEILNQYMRLQEDKKSGEITNGDDLAEPLKRLRIGSESSHMSQNKPPSYDEFAANRAAAGHQGAHPGWEQQPDASWRPRTTYQTDYGQQHVEAKHQEEEANYNQPKTDFSTSSQKNERISQSNERSAANGQDLSIQKPQRQVDRKPALPKEDLNRTTTDSSSSSIHKETNTSEAQKKALANIPTSSSNNTKSQNPQPVKQASKKLKDTSPEEDKRIVLQKELLKLGKNPVITEMTDEPSAKTPEGTTPASFTVEQDFTTEGVDLNNVFNVLLLGETGVGKTTFVNSFANYVKYGSMDEALKKGPVILIKSSITISSNTEDESETNEIQEKIITVEARCDRGKKNSTNEHLKEGGESSTQEPLIHCIRWEEDGTTKLLRLIDTPGVNDTRGARKDESNFDKILSLIARVGTLHAICILLKPNEAKLSLGFRKCLDDVLVKLHRSATNNILFCFTNTRSTLYRPGDTMGPLTIYLKKLEKTAELTIKAENHNIFCFDNDCFRYMCILMNDHVKNESHTTLSKGWGHNIQECKKLLAKVQRLEAHHVEDTINIGNAKKFLTAMAVPLTDIAMNFLRNRRIVETEIQKVRELRAKGKHLESIVDQRQLVMRRIKLPEPQTVCTNPTCSTVCVTDNYYDYVPKIICHNKYHQPFTKPPISNGDSTIMEFDTADAICQECKCPFKKHIHSTHTVEETWELVATHEQQEQFKACTNDKQRAELTLANLENNLANIKNEYALIKETSVEFSAFLQFNSLNIGTDPYLDHMHKLIEREENMRQHREDDTILSTLNELLNEYKKGVAHNVKEMKEKRKPPLTTAELWRKFDNLGRLKISGSVIADIAKELREQQASSILHGIKKHYNPE